MDATYASTVELGRYQRTALVVGAIALVAALVAGVVFGLDLFFRSYLVGYVFWVGIALGCLAILMLQHLTGGAWGVVTRRVLEAGSRTLLPMALLFIPIAVGLVMNQLYVWTSHDHATANPVLNHAIEHKAQYLNVPFFIVRTVIYFLVWLGLAYFLNKWSLDQDRTADREYAKKLKRLSGPGIVFFVIAVTFASVDWIMSLEPEWFSTIFGLLVLIGWVLSALSFVIAVMVLLVGREPLARVVAPAHFHDLGKLLLAFVMVWAYFSFSQFLIIWSGNLPEETPWYLRRMHGVWGFVGLGLVLLHFALPFFLLLSRDLKRNARTLAAVALLVLVMRLVDLLWLIVPAFHHLGYRQYPAFASVLYLLVPIGLGGLWVFLFAWQLQKRPLLPFNDPKFEAAVEHRHHH